MSDPQSEILVALMRGTSLGMNVTSLRLQTKRSDSTIRNHLRVMEQRRTPPWVEKVSEMRADHGWRWRLTEKGREVARYRAGEFSTEGERP